MYGLCTADSSGEEHGPWWVDGTAVEVKNVGSPDGPFVFKKENMKLWWEWKADLGVVNEKRNGGWMWPKYTVCIYEVLKELIKLAYRPMYVCIQNCVYYSLTIFYMHIIFSDHIQPLYLFLLSSCFHWSLPSSPASFPPAFLPSMCDALGLLRITCIGRGHLLEYEQLANGYTNEEKTPPPGYY